MFRSSPYCLLVILLMPWTARADLITLTSSQSTTIFSESENSNSQNASLFLGRNGAGAIRRALIEFDISGAVPSGATITAVSLQLVLSSASGGETVLALHPLLAEWGEGSLSGGGPDGRPAGPGDATWTKRIYNTTDWATPGGDFSPSASATKAVTDTQVGSVVWSSGQMAADVQGWLDFPSANFGWLLLNENETSITENRRSFYTEEHADPFARPKLSITFTPASVPEPSSVIFVTLATLGSAAVYGRRRCLDLIHLRSK